MNYLFNLMLLCGLVITTLVNGTTIHKNHNLIEAVHKLQEYHHFSSTKWVGKAVFTPFLEKVESHQDSCTCEKLVLVGMLNVYTDIFTDMLKDAKETEASLTELQNSVTHLRNNTYGKMQDMWKHVKDINSIEKHVKSRTVQGGALNDFLAVYTKATSLAKNEKKAGVS